MPRRATAKGLYRRGPYWLDWDRRGDGSLRSPYLAIFWYDAERGRIRSASTGTDDERAGSKALDRRFLQTTEGAAICPTCGARRGDEGSYFVTDAIADYLALKDDKTLTARLGHVVDYIGTLETAAIRCRHVNEAWVEGFRTWAATQPVVHSSGKVREAPRALSTIENSLIALAAAITAAHDRGDTAKPVQFRPIQTSTLNRTPQRRLGVKEMARAFKYAIDPKYPKKRAALHRFLMFSVGTLARPDAAHDFSTATDRQQWNSEAKIVALNPRGRRQTKKYRPTLPAPWQLAQQLDARDGKFVGATSVRSAHDTMCIELGWPKDGENGLKLWRRSMAKLLRDRLPKADWKEIELVLGHDKFDSVSDIYAPFDPGYLGAARAEIETIIAEIEALVPGSFHRSDTGAKPNVVPMQAAKRA